MLIFLQMWKSCRLLVEGRVELAPRKMDRRSKRRGDSYRYVLRRRPKINDDGKNGHHHDHHHNKDNNNQNSGGHHHHHDMEQHRGNASLPNHLTDKTFGSRHELNSTRTTHKHGHTGHGVHDHMTSGHAHDHDIQQKQEHFNHDFVMNHTMHNAMNGNMDSIYNSTNSTAYDRYPGSWNNTMPILHHGSHHGRDHSIQHGQMHKHISGHGKMDHSQVDHGHMMGHGGHMGGHMDGHGHHHGMQMYFSLKTDSYFLFEGLKISSIEGILSAMIFTIVLTIMLEALAHVIHFRVRHRKQLKVSTFRQVSFHFGTSVMHLLNIGSAYVAMLCVMSMNIWLLLSVVVGSGFGHLLMKPLLESCCSKPDGHVAKPKKLNSGHTSVNAPLRTDYDSLERDNKPNGHMATEIDVLMTCEEK